MKKLMAAFALTTTLFACQTKADNTGNAKIPDNANGYNMDSTVNTQTVLNTVKALNEMDTATYRTFYASDAIFHDNMDSTNLDQNISTINIFKAKGVAFKITETAPIWELVNQKASPTGVTNYVISYQLAEYTKGDKKIKVVCNTVDAFKDGKIVEEWNTYDSRKISELLK